MGETPVSTSINVFKILLGRITFVVVSMVAGVIVARVLGPEGKGVYAFSVLFSNTVASMGTFDIGDSTIFFYNKRLAPLGSILFTNLVFIIFSSLIFMGAAAILKEYHLLPWQEIYFPNVLLFVALMIPLTSMRANFSDLLRGVQNFDAYNIILTAQPILYLMLIVTFLWVIPMGVNGALISSFVSMFVLTAINLYYFFPRFKPILRFDGHYLKEALKYGIKGHLGNVFHKFNSRLDQFFVSPYCGSGALGNYSISVMLAEMLYYIPDSIGIVAFPRISSSNQDDAAKITEKACRTTVVTMTVLAVMLAGIAELLVRILYGEPFLPAVLPIYFLLPGVIFMSISKVVSKYFSGVGRPEINTFTSFVSAIVTLGGCILLVPRFCISGAAVTSSIAYLVRALLDIGFYMHLSKSSGWALLLVRGEDFRQIARSWGQALLRFRPPPK